MKATKNRLDLTPFLKTSNPIYGKSLIFGGWQYFVGGCICVRRRTRRPDSPESSIVTLKHTRKCDPRDCFRGGPPAKLKKWGGEKIGRAAPCRHCHECGCTLSGGKCRRCNGAGTIRGYERRIVGGRRIAAEYDRLIRALPRVRYEEDGKDYKKPLRFWFAGGEGVVMGRFD